MELDAGGTTISLTALPQPHPNAIPALAVADVDGAVEELRAKGVPIAMDPIETPSTESSAATPPIEA